MTSRAHRLRPHPPCGPWYPAHGPEPAAILPDAILPDAIRPHEGPASPGRDDDAFHSPGAK